MVLVNKIINHYYLLANTYIHELCTDVFTYIYTPIISSLNVQLVSNKLLFVKSHNRWKWPWDTHKIIVSKKISVVSAFCQTDRRMGGQANRPTDRQAIPYHITHPSRSDSMVRTIFRMLIWNATATSRQVTTLFHASQRPDVTVSTLLVT